MLVNLAVAILCVDIIFVSAIERTSSYVGCVVVAALLHYFLLASFAWMLVEAVLQYLRFVKVLDTYVVNFMWKAALPAWGTCGRLYRRGVHVGGFTGVGYVWRIIR